MRHRLLSGLGLVAAAAVALAGCSSSGGGGTGTGNPPPPTTTTTGGPSPASTGVPVPAQKITLKFLSLAFEPATIKAKKQIVDSWNAAHPKIHIQLVQGSWDSVHNKLVTEFAGGIAPCIFQDAEGDIAGFAREGYLADLSSYISSELKNSIAPGVWKTVTVKGKVVAEPTLIQTYVVFANSKALSKAGVTVPSGATMSWDSFSNLAKKLTSKNQYGLGWGLKQPTATMMTLAQNFGAQFFTTNNGTTTISVGANELQVPKRIHEMAYTDKSIDPVSLTQSGGDVVPGFYADKYAMMVAGDYVAGNMITKAPKGFEWQVLPPLAGTSANQVANPQTLSVSASCKHIPQAGAFVNYVMQPKNLSSLAVGDWLIPSSSGARKAVLASTGGKNGWKQIIASGKYLTTAGFLTVGKYAQWKNKIAEPAFQQFLGNNINLDSLTKKLTNGWKQIAK